MSAALVPRLLLACAAAASLASATATQGAAREVPVEDPDSSRREVLAVLERLTRAMEQRDTALLASVFLPGARLVGMRPRGGGTALQALTVEQFAAFMARDRRERWVERLHDPEVRIDETLATVWAKYDFHFGTALSHCGTDAFQLLRTGEGWKIASLADTYRTGGCR